jgi:hypothetical protein
MSQGLGALGSLRSWAPNVLSDLERFIRTADDYDLFRVNPIQYGRRVGLSEADAIKLFVHTAKVGLFDMDWLLICAYCPQVAGSFRELDQLHPRFQCAFCNAINDVSLDDYIQVSFTVSSGVRDVIFRHPEMLSVVIGDVNAYFLVRQHFEILNRIIRKRSGTIVKTIGDAVMAGFERPQDAVCASIEMIEELSQFNLTLRGPWASRSVS